MQPILPNFSGSAQSMEQAQRDIRNVGDIAGDYLLRRERENERTYQRGREKVQDDRATTEWNQKQQLLTDGKTESAALSKASQMFAAPDALLGGVGQPTAIAQANTNTMATGGLNEAPMPTVGTDGRYVVTKGTPDKLIKGVIQPGYYTDTNPQVLFNQSVPGKAPVKDLGAFPMLTSIKNGLMGVTGGNNDPKALANYAKAESAINSQYDMKLGELKNAMHGQGIKAAMTHSPEAQASYNQLSEQYNTLLGQKNTAIKGLEGRPLMVDKLRSTNLNDIDQTRVFNKDGSEILGNKAPTSQDQYMQTKQDKLLVNLKDIGKAVQNSYVPEAKTPDTWKAGTPDNVHFIAGTSAKTLPTRSTNPETGKVTTGSVSTKVVVNTVNNAASSYTGILNDGQPTTADKVTSVAMKMRDYVMKEHPELDFMHVTKMSLEAAKMQIPDGSMTAKETATMNARAKDLERSQTVHDTNQKHGWDVQAAGLLAGARRAEFNATYGLDAARLAESIKHNRASESIDQLKSVGKEPMVSMFRTLANGEHHNITVPVSQAKLYEDKNIEGGAFTLGQVSGTATKTAKTTGGTSPLTGLAEWGKTDQAKAVVAAQRIRAANPTMSVSLAETIAAEELMSGLTDTIWDSGLNKRIEAAGYHGKLK